MSKVTHDELVSTTLSAIVNTHKIYLDWSGDEWLWNAPEYLLTVKIAEKIAKIPKNKFVTLEDSVKKTLNTAGADKGHKTSRANGRFDIVVWWAKGDPRAIIEVKHRVYMYQNIAKDIDRICDTLMKKSTISCGLVAFYMDRKYESNAKSQFQEKVDELIEKTEDIVKKEKKLNITTKKKIVCKDSQNVFAAVVFSIRK